jgi:hypothetical protein
MPIAKEGVELVTKMNVAAADAAKDRRFKETTSLERTTSIFLTRSIGVYPCSTVDEILHGACKALPRKAYR